nr:lrr receptor-like serine/threonine-protein kinase gso1 [Quercus suber]
MIPKKPCQLEKIGIMDLSRNSFSGTIPYCFCKITFGQIDASEFVYISDASFSAFGFPLPYKSLLNNDLQIQGTEFGLKKQVEIDFLTKYRSNLYMALNLDIMSALDLSFNSFTKLVLQSIDRSYSENIHKFDSVGELRPFLQQFEWEIPSTLIALNFLEVFNATHNNLSGKVSDFKAQFGTFDRCCYKGNPFLCGPPLEKRCTMLDDTPSSPRQYSMKWILLSSIQVYLYLILFSFSV